MDALIDPKVVVLDDLGLLASLVIIVDLGDPQATFPQASLLNQFS